MQLLNFQSHFFFSLLLFSLALSSSNLTGDIKFGFSDFISQQQLKLEEDLRAMNDEEQLKERYPEQWALFDSLDLDNSGRLNRAEIFAGLKDWGYTAEDASDSFDMLDTDKTGRVSLAEFIKGWPKLEASFVPSRYRGELIGLLRQAKDIKTNLLGGDPVAVLRVSGQEMRTKRDSQTSVVGNRGAPVWMQTFDFKCTDPNVEDLEIVVESGSLLGGGKVLAQKTVSLRDYAKLRNQKVKIDLEPQGSVWLDLSYAEFV